MNRQGAERCRRAGTRTLLHPKEQALDQTEEEGEEEKAFSMRQGTTFELVADSETRRQEATRSLAMDARREIKTKTLQARETRQQQQQKQQTEN